MRILVIGSGGREHALAWKLARSPDAEVYAAPGNPGTAQVAVNLPLAGATPKHYLEAARAAAADLTVVGPEAPLVEGIVDLFRAEGLRIFGPPAAVAALEGSKLYAKRFFERHGIPTARFHACESAAEAIAALSRFHYPVVVKADGLAAGKGVVIAQDESEARAAITSLGHRLVLEEFLQGEELSFIAICDGVTALPLEPSQDHKRVFDNDQGPNTGGMGAYSDSRLLSALQRDQILETIILPTVRATRFTGFLYAGLMMTADGPKVLEFNVRSGDPETQPLLHRLQSGLAEVLWAATEQNLHSQRLDWSPDPSVCVVLASGGYPGAYQTGAPISGITEAETTGAMVFHAGTRQGAAGLETAGGRVLGVTCSGPTLAAAIDRTYAAVRCIHFQGAHYRTDIGRKGLSRYNEGSVGT